MNIFIPLIALTHTFDRDALRPCAMTLAKNVQAPK